VVRNNEVIIVDEHTGRLMAGRRYSEGLHGALEAKENVTVQKETQTMATITFQNLFRMYNTLSGMTGTADTEAVEFNKIYSLDVVVVPTNRPIARADLNDLVFRTAKEKFEAVAKEIAEIQEQGQPILVGTVSVEKSELLSSLLNKRGVKHEILNAKNHSREADIIAKAGHKGNVTIATSMAGRGTDIQLGEGVLDLGGLYVISTERHDSRRIDNQLRGRSGRQGDPGKSRFYLSLEDDLMRIFASDRISGLMKTLGMEEGEAIESPMVTRAIEKAQKRVEEQNFSARKHLLEYDDVMNQQRQVIYGMRNDALRGESDVEFLEPMITAIAESVALKHSPENSNSTVWDFDGITKDLNAEFGFDVKFGELDASETNSIAIGEIARETAVKNIESKFSHIDPEARDKITNYIFLQIIDHSWKNHLLAMDALKDSVSLRGYGQRDPLQEYKKEAFKLFELLVGKIEEETTLTLVRMPKPELTMARPQESSHEDLEYDHPEAQAAANQQSAPTPDEDGMIYHGSRADSQPEEKQQPFVRDGQKVGRNDPCPCGSGKKYKKCHGKLN
jgi:preprotein translocase subunit SecA